MKTYIALLLIALATTCTVSVTFPGFLKPGKELIYEYQATVRTGTEEPVSQASQFTIKAHLHLHHNINSITASFSNLEYTVFNGKINNHDEFTLKHLPLPPEAKDITSPFKIVYDESGRVTHISTQKDEKEYARNMKRAIASIMQLDIKNLKLHSNVPHAFETEEKSIYGRIKVKYNIIPGENEIIVHKMQDVKSAKKWYHYYGYNEELQMNKNNFENLVSTDSQRLYTLVNSDNNTLVISKIESHGGVYVTPYKNEAATQYMTVNQTMKLINKRDTKENEFHTDYKEEINALTYHYEVETDSGTIADITLGRDNDVTDTYIKAAYKFLEDTVAYSDQNHLKMQKPNLEYAHAIETLNYVLSKLDMTGLKTVYITISEKLDAHNEKLLKYFQKIIPVVGTRASTLFIKSLIIKKMVKEDIAIDMLNKMARHIRRPSLKLLTEVEDLLTLNDDISCSIRKTAILSFATLLYKTYKYEQMYKRNITLDKYITQFIDKIKTADDYSTQYLYMNALYNIKVGNVSKYLEPFVKGEMPNINYHLRYLAMCASYSEVIKDPTTAYDTYWPIFTNRKLHLQLRTGAYTILTSASLNRETLLNIYSYLKTEPSNELYNFFYTHMKTVASTVDPFMQKYKNIAENMLKIARKPYGHPITGNYEVAYTDPKYKFTTTLNAMVTSTNTSTTFYLDFNSQAAVLPFGNMAVWIKFDGYRPFNGKLNKIAWQYIISDGLSVGTIIKLLTNYTDLNIISEKLHIETAMFNDDQIIHMTHYNATNIKDLTKLESAKNDSKNLWNKLNIMYTEFDQIILVNDIGFPAIFERTIPSIYSNKGYSITKYINESNINLQQTYVEYKHSVQLASHLCFYNPVSNLWQGIQGSNSYDFSLPLNYIRSSDYKFIIKRNENKENDTFGLRSYKTSLTYVFQFKEEYLQQQAENSKHDYWLPVLKGSEYSTKEIIFDKDDENTGLHYQVALFDNEEQYSSQKILSTVEKLLQTEHKNSKTPLDNFLLTTHNLLTYIQFLPGTATNGILIRAKPTSKYDVSHINIILQCFVQFYESEELAYRKNIKKIYTGVEYSLQNNAQQSINTWNINATLDFNPTQTISILKAHAMRTAPDKKDWLMCVEGEKQWLKNIVAGHFLIAIENTSEYKCKKNETLIEITMKGEKSDEQLQNIQKLLNKYDLPEKCKYIYTPNLPSHINTDCLEKYTSYRKYHYDIKTKDLQQASVFSIGHNLLNYMNGKMSHKIIAKENDNTVAEENMKIIVEYPMKNDDLHVHINDNNFKYNTTIRGHPGLSWLGLYPDNYYLHNGYIFFTKHNLMQTHTVYLKKISEIEDNSKIPKDGWLPVLKWKWIINEQCKAEKDCKSRIKVDVKQIKSKESDEIKMALRVIYDSNTIEISEGKTTLNGSPLPTSDIPYKHYNWFSHGLLFDTHILYIHHIGTYLDFNEEYLRIGHTALYDGMI